MKNLVILTGAGMSAESGISTFRDSDGLWEKHDVMDVCSVAGWKKNPGFVLEFYNERRKQLMQCKPNAAHRFLATLEKDFNVQIITQNVDNLHERAGSSKVLHLHGELMKVRSEMDEYRIYEVDQNKPEICIGDKDEHGAQLRPHIVFFGEQVPAMETAAILCSNADIFVIIGTSLVVYPAASLIDYVRDDAQKFLIDPKPAELKHINNLTIIEDVATKGVKKLKKALMKREEI